MTTESHAPLEASGSARPTLACFWILLPVVAGGLLAWFPLYSGDLWMHLASAREIIARGSIPREDIFLYTAEGRRWINHSWGAQLLYYGVFRLGEALRGEAGGGGAIVLLRSLLVAGGAGIFWLHAVRRGARQAVAAGSALALLPVALPFLLARPLLLMPLFAGGLLLLLARPTWPRLIAAAGIQILWANMHASAPLGPVIALALALEASAGSRLPWFEPDPRLGGGARRLWLGTGLLALAALLNPNHIHIYLYAYELRQLDWVSRDIREWRPPDLLDPQYRHALVALVAVWGVAILQGAARRRLRLGDVLLLALVTIQAVSARRFLMLWSFFALPVAAVSVSVAVSSPPRARSLVTVCLLLLGGLLAGDRVVQRGIDGMEMPLLQEDAAPLGAVRFLRENGIRGRIACSPYAGGAIHWGLPDSKAATDGRCLVNDPETIRAWNAIANNRPGWQKAIPEPGTSDVLLLETAYLTPLHTLYPEWGVAYWDERWEVWLRRNGRFGEVLAAHDESVSSPHIVIALYDAFTPPERTRMMEQLTARVSREPKNGLARALLGHVLYRESVEWLGVMTRERLGRLHAEDPAVAARFDQRARAAFLEAIGCLKASLRLFRKDQVLNPRQSRSHYGAARSLLWMGRPREAAAHFTRAARIDPLNWVHARNAILYYLEFLDAVESINDPVGRDTLLLLRRVTQRARAEREAIARVLRRMDRLSQVPDWLFREDDPAGGAGPDPRGATEAGP